MLNVNYRMAAPQTFLGAPGAPADLESLVSNQYADLIAAGDGAIMNALQAVGFGTLLKVRLIQDFIGKRKNLENSVARNPISLQRTIFGAGSREEIDDLVFHEGTPKIEPKLVELYIRLPMFVRLYKELLFVEEDDKTKDNFYLVLKAGSPFSNIFYLVGFDQTQGSIDNIQKAIIEECNILSKLFAGKDSREIINLFIDEVNRSYGLVNNEIFREYKSNLVNRFATESAASYLVTGSEKLISDVEPIERDGTYYLEGESPISELTDDTTLSAARLGNEMLELKLHKEFDIYKASKAVDRLRKKVGNFDKFFQDKYGNAIVSDFDHFTRRIEEIQERVQKGTNDGERYMALKSGIADIHRLDFNVESNSNSVVLNELVLFPITVGKMIAQYGLVAISGIVDNAVEERFFIERQFQDNSLPKPLIEDHTAILASSMTKGNKLFTVDLESPISAMFDKQRLYEDSTYDQKTVTNKAASVKLPTTSSIVTTEGNELIEKIATILAFYKGSKTDPNLITLVPAKKGTNNLDLVPGAEITITNPLDLLALPAQNKIIAEFTKLGVKGFDTVGILVDRTKGTVLDATFTDFSFDIPQYAAKSGVNVNIANVKKDIDEYVSRAQKLSTGHHIKIRASGVYDLFYNLLKKSTEEQKQLLIKTGGASVQEIEMDTFERFEYLKSLICSGLFKVNTSVNNFDIDDSAFTMLLGDVIKISTENYEGIGKGLQQSAERICAKELKKLKDLYIRYTRVAADNKSVLVNHLNSATSDICQKSFGATLSGHNDQINRLYSIVTMTSPVDDPSQVDTRLADSSVAVSLPYIDPYTSCTPVGTITAFNHVVYSILNIFMDKDTGSIPHNIYSILAPVFSGAGRNVINDREFISADKPVDGIIAESLVYLFRVISTKTDPVNKAIKYQAGDADHRLIVENVDHICTRLSLIVREIDFALLFKPTVIQKRFRDDLEKVRGLAVNLEKSTRSLMQEVSEKEDIKMNGPPSMMLKSLFLEEYSSPQIAVAAAATQAGLAEAKELLESTRIEFGNFVRIFLSVLGQSSNTDLLDLESIALSPINNLGMNSAKNPVIGVGALFNSVRRLEELSETAYRRLRSAQNAILRALECENPDEAIIRYAGCMHINVLLKQVEKLVYLVGRNPSFKNPFPRKKMSLGRILGTVGMVKVKDFDVDQISTQGKEGFPWFLGNPSLTIYMFIVNIHNLLNETPLVPRISNEYVTNELKLYPQTIATGSHKHYHPILANFETIEDANQANLAFRTEGYGAFSIRRGISDEVSSDMFVYCKGVKVDEDREISSDLQIDNIVNTFFYFDQAGYLRVPYYQFKYPAEARLRPSYITPGFFDYADGDQALATRQESKEGPYDVKRKVEASDYYSEFMSSLVNYAKGSLNQDAVAYYQNQYEGRSDTEDMYVKAVDYILSRLKDFSSTNPVSLPFSGGAIDIAAVARGTLNLSNLRMLVRSKSADEAGAHFSFSLLEAMANVTGRFGSVIGNEMLEILGDDGSDNTQGVHAFASGSYMEYLADSIANDKADVADLAAIPAIKVLDFKNKIGPVSLLRQLARSVRLFSNHIISRFNITSPKSITNLILGETLDSMLTRYESFVSNLKKEASDLGTKLVNLIFDEFKNQVTVLKNDPAHTKSFTDVIENSYKANAQTLGATGKTDADFTTALNKKAYLEWFTMTKADFIKEMRAQMGVGDGSCDAVLGAIYDACVAPFNAAVKIINDNINKAKISPVKYDKAFDNYRNVVVNGKPTTRGDVLADVMIDNVKTRISNLLHPARRADSSTAEKEFQTVVNLEKLPSTLYGAAPDVKEFLKHLKLTQFHPHFHFVYIANVLKDGIIEIKNEAKTIITDTIKVFKSNNYLDKRFIRTSTNLIANVAGNTPQSGAKDAFSIDVLSYLVSDAQNPLSSIASGPIAVDGDLLYEPQYETLEAIQNIPLEANFVTKTTAVLILDQASYGTIAAEIQTRLDNVSEEVKSVSKQLKKVSIEFDDAMKLYKAAKSKFDDGILGEIKTLIEQEKKLTEINEKASKIADLIVEGGRFYSGLVIKFARGNTVGSLNGSTRKSIFSTLLCFSGLGITKVPSETFDPAFVSQFADPALIGPWEDGLTALLANPAGSGTFSDLNGAKLVIDSISPYCRPFSPKLAEVGPYIDGIITVRNTSSEVAGQALIRLRDKLLFPGGEDLSAFTYPAMLEETQKLVVSIKSSDDADLALIKEDLATVQKLRENHKKISTYRSLMSKAKETLKVIAKKVPAPYRKSGAYVLGTSLDPSDLREEKFAGIPLEERVYGIPMSRADLFRDVLDQPTDAAGQRVYHIPLLTGDRSAFCALFYSLADYLFDPKVLEKGTALPVGFTAADPDPTRSLPFLTYFDVSRPRGITTNANADWDNDHITPTLVVPDNSIPNGMHQDPKFDSANKINVLVSNFSTNADGLGNLVQPGNNGIAVYRPISEDVSAIAGWNHIPGAKFSSYTVDVMLDIIEEFFSITPITRELSVINSIEALARAVPKISLRVGRYNEIILDRLMSSPIFTEYKEEIAKADANIEYANPDATDSMLPGIRDLKKPDDGEPIFRGYNDADFAYMFVHDFLKRNPQMKTVLSQIGSRLEFTGGGARKFDFADRMVNLYDLYENSYLSEIIDSFPFVTNIDGMISAVQKRMRCTLDVIDIADNLSKKGAIPLTAAFMIVDHLASNFTVPFNMRTFVYESFAFNDSILDGLATADVPTGGTNSLKHSSQLDELLFVAAVDSSRKVSQKLSTKAPAHIQAIRPRTLYRQIQAADVTGQEQALGSFTTLRKLLPPGTSLKDVFNSALAYGVKNGEVARYIVSSILAPNRADLNEFLTNNAANVWITRYFPKFILQAHVGEDDNKWLVDKLKDVKGRFSISPGAVKKTVSECFGGIRRLFHAQLISSRNVSMLAYNKRKLVKEFNITGTPIIALEPYVNQQRILQTAVFLQATRKSFHELDKSVRVVSPLIQNMISFNRVPIDLNMMANDVPFSPLILSSIYLSEIVQNYMASSADDPEAVKSLIDPARELPSETDLQAVKNATYFKFLFDPRAIEIARTPPQTQSSSPAPVLVSVENILGEIAKSKLLAPANGKNPATFSTPNLDFDDVKDLPGTPVTKRALFDVSPVMGVQIYAEILNKIIKTVIYKELIVDSQTFLEGRDNLVQPQSSDKF